MTRRTYTPEYKAKLVIEVLQGEKELNTIAAENSISPNMLRNWKAEFLENAGRAFDGSRQAKYNGPIISDHSSKNYREHGKIQQESEKETTP